MAITEQGAGGDPRVRTDPDALNVVELLRQLAARVPHSPAITPYQGRMIRLGGMDRASYVWFLRCPEGFEPPAPVSGGGLCNHGVGVDRQYGAYEVRAWAHGAPGVHSVSLHTHTLTLELLETAAKLVGIPLEPATDQPTSATQGVEMKVSNYGFGEA